MKRIYIKTIAFTFVFLTLFSLTVSAFTPYSGYNYGRSLSEIPTLNAYEPEKVLWGGDLGLESLSAPKDLKVDSMGRFYLVESVKNRVIRFTVDFEVDAILEGFDNNGTRETFNLPEGIFVDSDFNMYICDTQNARIVKLDEDGNLLQIIANVVLTGSSNTFKPQKVSVDSAGRIYVVSVACTDGLIQLNEDGEFVKFFGSNSVVPDPLEIIYRMFLTREQKQKREQFVPTEYSNVLVDDRDFVYTTTQKVETDQIKRLNAKGSNVLITEGRTGNKYGNYVRTPTGWNKVTAFVDLRVDEDDNIYALDKTSCKVFVYDSYGNLLFNFGGEGTANGLFTSPAAIELKDNKVYVLDETNGMITIFGRTEFGEKILEANRLYQDGEYAESLEPWQEVLAMDSNYDLAYIGIGKALLKAEDYDGAMEAFKNGRNREYYSDAFEKQRNIVLREHFTEIVVGIVVVLILVVVVFKILKKHNISFIRYINS